MERNSGTGYAPAGLLRKYGFLVLGWSALIIGSLLWDVQREAGNTLDIAAAAARADIGKDLIFRKWAASHGGVYVTPTEHTPPNPYLKVPDRDVVTTTGKQLTLMNPAYMLREMQNDFPGEYGTRSHITSLKLLNPKNAPDAWEREALRAFERGEKERLEVEQIDGQPHLRLMRPLIAEQGCLKCHAFQGYKEGEIRGGLSTMIPLVTFLVRERESDIRQAWTHGAIWLIGLAGLGISYRRERKQSGEREKMDAQLRVTSLYTRSLVEASLDPLVTISPEGKITDVNQATEKVTGRSRAELVGTDFSDYFTEPDKARAGYREVFAKGSVTDYPLAIRHLDGHITDVLYNASIYRGEAGEVLGVFAAARDVTERKRNEAVNAARLHLVHFSMTHPLAELLEETLNEAERLTGSLIGFYHFVDDDQVTLTLQGWSTRTKAEFCKAEGEGLHYPISQAGVWVDCVREGKAVIHNDYASLPHRKGMPAGHAPVVRELVVPVFRGGRIRAILGVGNKPSDYTTKDIETVSLVADLAWEIAERKRAETEREQYFKFFNISTDLMGIADLQGAFKKVNPTFIQTLGYAEEEILAKPFIELVHPDDRQSTLDEVARQLQSGYTTDFENRYVCKDGSWRWLSWHATYSQDEELTYATARDITESKKAQERQRRSEHSLAEAQRIAHLGNWELDLASNVLAWSDEIYRIFEIDHEKFGASYEAFLDAIHPEDREAVNKAYTDSLATRTPYDIVHRLLMKDGRIKYVNEKCETYYGEDGTPLRSVGTVHDITERKLAEEELREKEERLALATLHNGVGIWDWNLVTQEMIWDDSMFALYHIRREDFIGTEEAWRASLHPDDLGRGDKEVEAAIAGIRPFDTDFRVVWPNGEVHHIKAVAKVFRDEQGKPLRMLGTNMDITALKEAEMKLRELNNDFVALLENTGDFIYFKDKDSRIIFCSQTLADITGHKSWRDMVGKHDLEIFPPDIARIYYEEELPIFREGKPLLNKTDPYYDQQGKRRWVNTNKWPVFGEDGRTVAGIFGMSRDITELKEAEDKVNELNRDLEQRVEERTAQLEAANKELEAFSYSVSHDLRTPLRAIDGFSRILLEDYDAKLDDEGKRLLKVVRDNTGRMGQLIDDILQFSRAGRLELNYAEIDMGELARSAYEELRSVMPAGHETQVEIGPLPAMTGDRAMMRQVFVNLLSNALKFSRGKEHPRIRIGARVEGNEAVYFVEDNGAGFDMQYVDKLFGVFQRLHGVTEFEGTGIGLAIVKRIVTRHGGRVWAEGRLGEGATIYFALPIKEATHD